MRLTSSQGTKSPLRRGRRRERKPRPKRRASAPELGVDAGDHELALARLEQDVLHAHEGAAAHVEHLVVEHARRRARARRRAARPPRAPSSGHAEQQPLAVDVDLARPAPRRRASCSSSRSMKKAVTTGGSVGVLGDHVDELADLDAGGVDDLHVSSSESASEPGSSSTERRAHPFAGRGAGEDTARRARPSIDARGRRGRVATMALAAPPVQICSARSCPRSTDPEGGRGLDASQQTPARATRLERFFKFKQWDTSLKRDTLAGLTTFIVMAYIIFVNPSILGLGGAQRACRSPPRSRRPASSPA